MSITRNELKEYLSRQLDYFTPDGYKLEGADTESALDLALERLEHCMLHINFRHYSQDGQVNFQHLYSDQYSQFLYFYANSLWKLSQNKPLCDKMIVLNKSLNGILCPYTVELPDIFLFLHPIGTIVGNAVFSDYLVIMQNVTVNFADGSDGLEPLRIGKGVTLSAGCKIIGNKRIGDRSSIGTNTVIYNQEVGDDMIAYTDEKGELRIKRRKKECKAEYYFRVRFDEK